MCWVVCAQNALPNSQLTPGAVRRGVTKAEVCTIGSAHRARNVPIAEKRAVYEEYGIRHWVTGENEVDHLIPLELGGSNGIKNLWPEPYGTKWNAHAKDALEDRLHEMVCREGLPLETAQQWIATDWIAAYKRVFHTDSPLYVQKSRRPRERAY
jgi:hypothetical protein